ncbi:MAG: ABC transporter ATP-binding protein [Nitrososphaerota archaeon]|nr:ABC transporter ATP-binding protein [Candidatus Calditenuaceae archaeon]MDW8072893.1 ABC transporter ATP-binding protein [Nitrososphaerota archaeon]
MNSETILTASNVRKYFPIKEGIVKAVDGVSFSIKYGETLALVGESGSGKTTTGHVIMGFYTPDAGELIFKGRYSLSTPIKKRDLELKRDIQIVFQDPGTSLNPKHMVKDIVGLPLRIHRLSQSSSIYSRVAELLDFVGLGADFMFKYPSELGGGEKQLVAIARALAPNPSFIILDESTSALDVSSQAKVLKTLSRIQREHNISYLLITHDLGVVRNISHRVMIMYLGKIYEEAATEEFFHRPLHPYTQMLLSSIPTLTEDDEAIKPKGVESVGETPSALNPPKGCRFHTRCPFAKPICSERDPPDVVVDSGHIVRCWLYE